MDEIDQIRQWRRNIPPLHNESYRRLYDKAVSGKSRSAGVKSKCLECMGWQSSEVKNCSIVACPLHPYRPYQSREEKQGKKSESVLEAV
jgi:hypothetical protein